MKRKIFKIFITIIVAAAATLSFITIKQQQALSKVKAIGDLTVDFHLPPGVPLGGPIFVINNLAPGYPPESHEITMVNNASVIRPVGIRGENKSPDGTNDLSPGLDLVISSGIIDLYGGSSPTGTKTLADFFNETTPANGIELFILNPGETKTITVTVTFKAESGNEFQSASVVFDVIVGISVELPEACQEIDITGSTIFGTQ